MAIARALLSKPEIVLADEPTGNLDSKSGEQVLNLLEEMRKEYGLTLVLVSHDERIAARADRTLQGDKNIVNWRVMSMGTEYRHYPEVVQTPGLPRKALITWEKVAHLPQAIECCI